MQSHRKLWLIGILLTAGLTLCGPALAGTPVAIWIGGSGIIILFDFSSDFSAAEISQLQDLLSSNVLGSSDLLSQTVVLGPSELPGQDAASVNATVLAIYPQLPGGMAYIYMVLNKIAGNIDIRTYLSTPLIPGYTNKFMLGLQIPEDLTELLSSEFGDLL